jgi:hypothetical protein
MIVVGPPCSALRWKLRGLREPPIIGERVPSDSTILRTYRITGSSTLDPRWATFSPAGSARFRPSLTPGSL